MLARADEVIEQSLFGALHMSPFGRSRLFTATQQFGRYRGGADIQRAERDRNRLVLQQAEGISAGRDLLRTRMVQEPLSKVARTARPLNPAAQEIVARPPAAQ